MKKLIWAGLLLVGSSGTLDEGAGEGAVQWVVTAGKGF